MKVVGNKIGDKVAGKKNATQKWVAVESVNQRVVKEFQYIGVNKLFKLQAAGISNQSLLGMQSC